MNATSRSASPNDLPLHGHRPAGGSRAGARAHPTPDARELRKRAARERLVILTRLLDSAVAVPGLRTRVGLDALLGVIPGVGDLVSGALGIYLVLEARQLGASRWLQARMVGNLLVDTAVGAVPIAGDLFDVYFKAHTRNLKLLQKELGEPFMDDAAAIDPRGARSGRPREGVVRDEVIEGEAIDVTHRR
jgi:hypothetical protein